MEVSEVGMMAIVVVRAVAEPGYVIDGPRIRFPTDDVCMSRFEYLFNKSGYLYMCLYVLVSLTDIHIISKECLL